MACDLVALLRCAVGPLQAHEVLLALAGFLAYLFVHLAQRRKQRRRMSGLAAPKSPGRSDTAASAPPRAHLSAAGPTSRLEPIARLGLDLKNLVGRLNTRLAKYSGRCRRAFNVHVDAVAELVTKAEFLVSLAH
eukprot:TRINITY_DN68123_c0_g1_i1.p1 TRINITY_DN68123_c0_g1~~TRINITY_DN68123_c0_g1_i1.p1  ORF type:complete len:134 (+),score=10.95 TRINITY_DN68123_c0_g1_i1:101-502(+)